MAKKTYREQAKKVAQIRKRRAVIKKVISRMILTFIVCTILTGSWMVYTGKALELKNKGTTATLEKLSEIGFSLETVYVDGLDNLDESEISDRLPAIKTPIFGISLKQLRNDLESIGWIKSASINRKLPDTLIINIEERKPKAIWQYQGKLSLIDHDGFIIASDDENNLSIWEYSSLPLIVGEDANTHANILLTFMSEEPEVMTKVSSIIRIGGRRWNVRMNNGIEVKLPEENPAAAWRRLADLHRKEKVLDRAIKDIDLRLTDRIFILPDDKV